jgi:sugar/nucleoside kinase (ribokinase family)
MVKLLTFELFQNRLRFLLTGTCAVLLTENGANRSLCANLAAANLFTKHHIEIPENRKFIDEADFFYITVINCPT